MVFTESPGSHTRFEVQDIPAIAEAIQGRGVPTGAPVLMLDNTWATGLGFRGFEHGVDVIVEAATKYLVGHSDAMLGVITVRNEEHFIKVKRSAEGLGNCPGSEETYLGLRGLRTLAVRLRQHEKNALEVARWLQQQPRVARVMYPPLADDPGHALWKRDFAGASGLLGIVLDQSYPRDAIAAFIDGLRYFGLGASWGGYESLILPFQPADGADRHHLGRSQPDPAPAYSGSRIRAISLPTLPRHSIAWTRPNPSRGRKKGRPPFPATGQFWRGNTLSRVMRRSRPR